MTTNKYVYSIFWEIDVLTGSIRNLPSLKPFSPSPRMIVLRFRDIFLLCIFNNNSRTDVRYSYELPTTHDIYIDQICTMRNRMLRPWLFFFVSKLLSPIKHYIRLTSRSGRIYHNRPVNWRQTDVYENLSGSEGLGYSLFGTYGQKENKNLKKNSIWFVDKRRKKAKKGKKRKKKVWSRQWIFLSFFSAKK